MLKEYPYPQIPGEISFRLHDVFKMFMSGVPIKARRKKKNPKERSKRVTPTVWFSYKRSRLQELTGVTLVEGTDYVKSRWRRRMDYLLRPHVIMKFIEAFPREQKKPAVRAMYGWLKQCGVATDYTVVLSADKPVLSASNRTDEELVKEILAVCRGKQSRQDVREKIVKSLNAVLDSGPDGDVIYLACKTYFPVHDADKSITLTNETGYASFLGILNGVLMDSGVITSPILQEYTETETIGFK